MLLLRPQIWLMGPVFAIGNLNIDIEDLALLILAFKKGNITKNKAEELLNQSVKENRDLSEELNKEYEKETAPVEEGEAEPRIIGPKEGV